MYATTPSGKIITSFCAFIGILMLALPLGVIRKNFNAFEKYNSRFEKIMDETTKCSLEDQKSETQIGQRTRLA
jgi:hypothetical protein